MFMSLLIRLSGVKSFSITERWRAGHGERRGKGVLFSRVRTGVSGDEL